MFLTFLCLQAGVLRAQVLLTESTPGRTDFELVTADSGATICYDAADAAVVRTVAGLFAADVARVTGREIPVADGQELPAKTHYAVIVGTVGQSRWIDELAAAKKLDVAAIEGGWERYTLRLVDRPGHGLRKALVIAGSDRRGTAYGLLSVSRAIGVSPWYWWADAPVEHRNRLTLSVKAFTSKSPSVKYRGIFINDEDWGLYRWAKENFEKELGNIGPKTYEKVCELLNRMVLSGQQNRLYATQQRAATDALAAESRMCHDSLRIITAGYNTLCGGKWDHVMTMNQGFAASYFQLPELRSVTLAKQASLGIAVEGEDVMKGMRSFHALPAFNTFLRRSYFVDVYNKGSEPLQWNASASDAWIVLSRTAGTTPTEERIDVSVDWAKVPVGDEVAGSLTIKSASGESRNVLVSVFNPATPTREELRGVFVQHNGYVSIDAANFHRKHENDAIQIRLVPNLGVENAAIQLGDPTVAKQNTRRRDVPGVEYDFYTFEQGSVDVYTYVLPTFVISADRGYAGHEATNLETQYGVAIDEGPVMNPSTSSIEYAQIWYESVLKNCRVNKTTLHIDKPGKHTVKILCGDAGTVLQKIVLDFGGMKRSYQGPPPTRIE